MESNNGKYDWCIITGSPDNVDIYHTDIIKNKSEEQLGRYIKTHVAELYEHITGLLNTDYGGKLRDMMKKIQKFYGVRGAEDIIAPETKDDFNKYVKKITEEINKFNDSDLYRELYGTSDQDQFVVVRRLRETKQYIFLEGTPMILANKI